MTATPVLLPGKTEALSNPITVPLGSFATIAIYAAGIARMPDGVTFEIREKTPGSDNVVDVLKQGHRTVTLQGPGVFHVYRPAYDGPSFGVCADPDQGGTLTYDVASAFLARGSIKGIGINAVNDDYENPVGGITPIRAKNIAAAGFNTHRCWIALADFLRPPVSLDQTVADAVSYVRKTVESTAGDFRAIVAIGSGTDRVDVTAAINDTTIAATWVTALTALATALAANFDETKVALETLNEPPTTDLAPTLYTTTMPLWFKTIRAAAPKMTIILQAAEGYRQELPNLNVADYDANTLYSFHPYNLGEFTHQGINANPNNYDIPYPPTRIVGGLAKAIDVMTQRVNRDTTITTDAARTAEIARYTTILTWAIFTGWQTWEDWTALKAWQVAQGLEPWQLLAGEMGIVSQFNDNGNEAMPDVATRANWLRLLRVQCDTLGFAGWVLHQMYYSFNIWQQTAFNTHLDDIIPEIQAAMFSDAAIPAGDPIDTDPYPTATTFEEVFPSGGAINMLSKYQLNDLTNIFQDVAGTYPVTASGQPVMRVNDTSGKGIHLLQADATKAPTLLIMDTGEIRISHAAGQYLEATNLVGGAFVAGGVEIDPDWSWQTVASFSQDGTTNQMIHDGTTGKYRSSRSGSLSTVISDDPFYWYINGVNDGAFLQGEPHSFSVEHAMYYGTTLVPLNCIKIGSDNFVGSWSSLVVTDAVPSNTQRKLLETLIATLNGGSALPVPVTVASVWNMQHVDVNYSNKDGLWPQMYTKTTHIIAGGARKSLQLVFPGFYNSKDKVPRTEFLNDIPISGYVLIYNNTVVPVTFDGSRSHTIVNGTIETPSDIIMASRFGVTSIPDLSQVVVKGLIDFKGSGNLPFSDRWVESNGTDQIIFANPTDTTVSGVDLPGDFVYSGATPYVEIEGAYQPFLMGQVLDGKANAILIHGDSIPSGQSGRGLAPMGYGWVQWATNGMDHPPAMLNFSVPGSQAEGLLGNDTVATFQKYCNGALLALGANNWQDGTSDAVADVMTTMQAWKTQLNTAGITKVAVAECGLLTSSDTSWIDEAGQTVATDWDEGGKVEQFNTALRAGGFTYVFQLNAIRGVDFYKWKTNGTGNWYTEDGDHLDNTASIAQGAVTKPDLEAVFVTGATPSTPVAPATDPTVFATQIAGGEAVIFNTDAGVVTATSGTGYMGAADGGFDQRAVSTKKIPAGVDGYWEYTAADAGAYDVIMALDPDSTNLTYDQMDAFQYFESGSNIFFGENTSSGNGNNGTAAPALTANTRIRIERRGAEWLLRYAKDVSRGQFFTTWQVLESKSVADVWAHCMLSKAVSFLNNPIGATRPAMASSTNIIWDGNSFLVDTLLDSNTDRIMPMADMLMDIPQTSGATFQNFGVSGQTTEQMLSDQSTQIFPAFIAGKRNILIVLEGLNDVIQGADPAAAAARLKQYCTQARTYADANSIDLDIVLIGPTPVDYTEFGTVTTSTPGGETADQLTASMATLYATLKSDYSTYAQGFVDLRALTAFSGAMLQAYSGEGIHPNSPGYILIVNALFAVIQSMLKA